MGRSDPPSPGGLFFFRNGAVASAGTGLFGRQTGKPALEAPIPGPFCEKRTSVLSG